MAEPHKRKTKFTGLKGHRRLQNTNTGDLSANLRPSQRELAEAKRKAGVAAQAKKPFNPGGSAVADSFGPTPGGKRLSPGLIGKLKKRALNARRGEPSSPLSPSPRGLSLEMEAERKRRKRINPPQPLDPIGRGYR